MDPINRHDDVNGSSEDSTIYVDPDAVCDTGDNEEEVDETYAEGRLWVKCGMRKVKCGIKNAE